MADVRQLIDLAERVPPAPGALAELPDVPLYVDDERPEVTSASKTRAAWRIDDDGAAEWAMRKRWEAEDEIARVVAEHAAERGRLLARVALIDARVQEITAGQRRRSAFFEAVLLEWMHRCRTAIVKGKAKSRKFLYGTLGWRQAPERLEYDDEAQAIAWARAQGLDAGLARLEWKLERDAIKRYAQAKGVVPPGARWVGGEDVPYVHAEKPAQPAPREVQPLQIVQEATP